PTLLLPNSELGSSRTMLQTLLSLKKSSPVNRIRLKLPLASKKKGSLRQPKKKRKSSALVTRASRPTETGAPWTTSSPSSPAPAARAPRRRRTVAICFPPPEDENCTLQPRSATASPSVSTLISYNAPGAKGSFVVGSGESNLKEGCTLRTIIDLSGSPGLVKA